MKTVIATFLCIVLASAIVDPAIRSKLDNIKKNELGQTLLKTIEVELQSSEPLDKLLDTLSNLEQQYQCDQREDDAANQKFQAQCDSDLSAFETDIAETDRKRVELQGQIDELKPVLGQRQGQLVAKKQLQGELQKEMDAVDEQRRQEAAEFEQKRQEMQLVVSVIQEAKRIFQTSFGNSFLQNTVKPTTLVQPEIMAQVNQHFTKIAQQTGKQIFGKPFSHIFKFLASMTTNNKAANSALVEKIIKLCDQLLDKVDESWTLERRAEDQRVLVYNSYKLLLTKDMNQYNTQIANLNTEIASLQDKLTSTTNSFDDVTLRINDKTTMRNDRREECQEAAYDYAGRRKSRLIKKIQKYYNYRDSDRDTVSQLIGIVNVNLRDLKEYIALRLAAGDNLA